MKRRNLLQLGLGAAAPPMQLWAAVPAPWPETPRVLVVFLRGAYDAANLLVPTASSFYYEARPNIAIAKAQALPLDAAWGLAPALADSIHPLWLKGQAAFVPFAGTHDTTRSHFETQDHIELGQPDDASRDFRSGFMNRLAGVLGAGSAGSSHLEAMAFTDQVPLILRGSLPVANQALRDLGKPAISASQAQTIAAMYAGTKLAGTVSGGFEVRDEVSREMAGEMEAASRNAIAAKGFALEARRVARLMRERVTLGFIDIGGWDTHVGEGGANGQLATKLGELGKGLALFADEMGPQWANTVVVVVSEFGRTFRENGNRGTDHGHGSAYWVLGGGVKGGRIAGEQVEVKAATLFQNRDWPVLNEYRALFGGLFKRIYGLNDAQLATVFPGASSRDIGLV
ncbi:DUF1501 domain-containing protein [Roseateles saccharophilus]|uniref:Uncharacterized protein (DUF1501 family) n=1 Tax=Roseateles saccharophilus TaxID=304 RepID=A0A4R3VF56_ROSSA|nr:DUF1501 domain-containing protein [Roseateles saccharophilus]MDG0833880.1 DUF1501 domain-containing protein [Roseateles saccharophilus]TCV02298.1 uncharacterized protein (DUF1501 family) [Roseateles saccharophilus]